MKKKSIRRFQVFFIIVICSCSAPAAAGELRIGGISERPVEIISYYNPLAQYLAGRLKSFNITSGKVVIARDIAEMVQKGKSKEVDIVFESAFATIEMNEKAGMLPKLLVWKKGVSTYSTLLFVRKESPIRSLKDLTGKVLVFESANSTSAYAIPKAELRRMGFAVIPLEGGRRMDAINYIFARQEINQAFQVLQKNADAGAFNQNDWEELPAKAREELRIIHRTKPVLRFVASFHPSLPEGLQTALINTLVDMDKDAEGLKVLQSAQRTTKIERLSDENLRSLDYVKDIMRISGK